MELQNYTPQSTRWLGFSHERTRFRRRKTYRKQTDTPAPNKKEKRKEMRKIEKKEKRKKTERKKERQKDVELLSQVNTFSYFLTFLRRLTAARAEKC